jgi:hypothetical protein
VIAEARHGGRFDFRRPSVQNFPTVRA